MSDFKITLAIKIIGFLLLHKQASSQTAEEIFSPNVAASCKTGFMFITVFVNNIDYKGMVHPRGFRRKPCYAEADGTNLVNLRIPLIDNPNDPQYCGVQVNQTSKEKYLPIVVRFHKTLELAEDKFYTIKCGPQGFINSRNQTNFVNLQLSDHKGDRIKEAIFDHSYRLQADISGPDKQHTMRMRNCISFSEHNESVTLTDEYGCAVGSYPLISNFIYNDSAGSAYAHLENMFKFPSSNRVHFQCDVFICRLPCELSTCIGRAERLTDTQQGRSIVNSGSSNSLDEGEGTVKATTSVYIVQPTATEMCGWYPRWLWILCIALAVLFIIMMIINIFLCSAMTCSCSKAEIIEKEPSIIDEYGPYRSSWHGSHYGSRYSLNGKGYTSGASTMNSARSISSHSDHYAIVHSRPDSRYSGHHSLKHQTRSPTSIAGSHYSHRI